MTRILSLLRSLTRCSFGLHSWRTGRKSRKCRRCRAKEVREPDLSAFSGAAWVPASREQG